MDGVRFKNSFDIFEIIIIIIIICEQFGFGRQKHRNIFLGYFWLSAGSYSLSSWSSMALLRW